MNKTKTTMEDVAAAFGDFEQKVEAKIADMNREQLAGALRSIIRTAHWHAEYAAQWSEGEAEDFATSRIICSAVREALNISITA